MLCVCACVCVYVCVQVMAVGKERVGDAKFKAYLNLLAAILNIEVCDILCGTSALHVPVYRHAITACHSCHPHQTDHCRAHNGICSDILSRVSNITKALKTCTTQAVFAHFAYVIAGIQYHGGLTRLYSHDCFHIRVYTIKCCVRRYPVSWRPYRTVWTLKRSLLQK